MAIPPHLVGFEEGLKRFSEGIVPLTVEVEKAIRLGGQPEAVTTQALIFPLLAALGYDPTNPTQCIPQSRPTSPSGKAGATVPMPSDQLLLPESPEPLLLEVKPLTISTQTLRKHTGQLDKYMRLHGVRVGLLTNGRTLLVYARVETSDGGSRAGVVGEYDLRNLGRIRMRELGFLHRNNFIARFWLGRLHQGANSKRLAKQNPVQFAQVPASLLEAVRRHCPQMNNSEILRSAIRFCETRLETVERRRQGYLQRVRAGASMEQAGFRLNNDLVVERVLEALRGRYPMAGPVKGRFGVHTLLGLLVEVWAEDQGVPEPFSP